MSTATFAAGCFWGVEYTFSQIPGVTNTYVGYMGGDLANPSYEDVCRHRTGHAEVVQVEFDPSQVSFHELLDVFWQCHNPTLFNRQGPDVGSQYRSAIFYHDEEQAKLAQDSKKALTESGKYEHPIVTEITPASIFYKAEEYHQRYVEKHGPGVCHIPKIDK